MPNDLDRLCRLLAREKPPAANGRRGPQTPIESVPEVGSELELIAIARALAGPNPGYSEAEIRLFQGLERPVSGLVEQTRRWIAAGGDPLGDAYCRIRSAEQRRTTGAVYTPSAIVSSMLEWAARETAPVRVVDPGVGSGRFILAAARRFPAAQLTAVDVDPLAILMLRANAAVHGVADRLLIDPRDFRAIELPEVNGPTLFIGNPPYVRHHKIGEGWKRWFKDAAARHDLAASQLAGLHIHFFLKIRDLALPGDFGALITSSEWLDVNYGALLRKMLTNGLGGTALHVFAPNAMPFGDTATTGAITCFKIGSQRDHIVVRSVDAAGQLGDLTSGRRISCARLEQTRRWSALLKPNPKFPQHCMQLGDIFRVHRGQVTGSNAVWIAGKYDGQLPDRILFPTVTRARELIDAGHSLASALGLRRVIDIPPDLDDLLAQDRERVERFLAWARECGADKSYIAQHRAPWWSVNLREPAPILCTYMARRPPVFVRNLCGARHLNIAHGLYPRAVLSKVDISALLSYLSGAVGVEMGRTYAGGLTKFEPGEVERIPIPRLDKLHEFDAKMVSGGTATGRPAGEGDLPTRTP